jgi:hypothetical protein
MAFDRPLTEEELKALAEDPWAPFKGALTLPYAITEEEARLLSMLNPDQLEIVGKLLVLAYEHGRQKS